MYKIIPSIMTCDILDMRSELKKIINSGINWIHFDLMDGKFVPNLGLCTNTLNAIKKEFPELTIDVHCMVNDLVNVFEEIKCGDYITIHLGSKQEIGIKNLIAFLKKHNKKIGIAFNLNDDLNLLEEIIEEVDLVTIMSIKPGFAGQIFEYKAWSNIERIKKLINQRNKNVLLQIDGGVRENNIKKIIESGINLVVVGSLLFSKNSIEENYKKIVSLLK